MARWVNYSGNAVSVPAVERDVDDGEEIDVADDVLLPANIFRRVDAEFEQPAEPDQPAPVVQDEQDEGE